MLHPRNVFSHRQLSPKATEEVLVLCSRYNNHIGTIMACHQASKLLSRTGGWCCRTRGDAHAQQTCHCAHILLAPHCRLQPRVPLFKHRAGTGSSQVRGVVVRGEVRAHSTRDCQHKCSRRRVFLAWPPARRGMRCHGHRARNSKPTRHRRNGFIGIGRHVITTRSCRVQRRRRQLRGKQRRCCFRLVRLAACVCCGPSPRAGTASRRGRHGHQGCHCCRLPAR